MHAVPAEPSKPIRDVEQPLTAIDSRSQTDPEISANAPPEQVVLEIEPVVIEEELAKLATPSQSAAAEIEAPVRDAADAAEPSPRQDPMVAGAWIPQAVDAETEEPAVQSSEPSLHDTRYRPPVAVKPIPLAVKRTDATAMVLHPAVQSVEEPDLAQQPERPPVDQTDGESVARLTMSRTQIRSLKLGGQLRRVMVGDQEVCQAVATGPNELKLIGTGCGITKLVVWADVGDQSTTLKRAFEVHVGEADAASRNDTSEQTRVLNESLVKMFPGCDVRVLQDPDALRVTGNCDCEESAKKIIRIVRKTCLVPVRDELSVR
jgi:hypothetical protein